MEFHSCRSSGVRPRSSSLNFSSKKSCLSLFTAAFGCLTGTGGAGCAGSTGGTDGTDGPCDAAGGVVDGESYNKGVKKGLKAEDFLKAHDAYNYLKHLDGEHIVTGPTGTNVMDIAVVLVE